ncbi:MAG: dephospho-CoA kinase [Candidatus Omnitrophota bacterium]
MKRRPRSSKKIIGLTGGFGTGKSTVAGILRSFGAKVIDADKISHGLFNGRTDARGKVIRAFGKGILGKHGEISRRKLAGIVFNDKKSLIKLNKIMHPAVISRIKLEIKNAKEELVVLDAPLLIEAKLDKLVDIVVVVKAGINNQIARAQKKSSFSRAEIIARIRAQMPLREKLRLADFIIDNNGTKKDTRKQVALIRRMWWRS